MDEQTERVLGAQGADVDDLDGHTIEELADYLDAGRTPPDPSIESSAACRHALAALERLRAVALLPAPGDDEPADDAWVSRLMSRISLDAHAGADFPIAPGEPAADLVMSEGALRAAVRAVGDDHPSFLVGRVRFSGDLAATEQPLTVTVAVTVLQGVAIPAAVAELRARVLDEVLQQTAFEHVRVDVTVQDLDLGTAGGAR